MPRTLNVHVRVASALIAMLIAADCDAASVPAAEANRQMISARYDPMQAVYPQFSDQGFMVRVMRSKEWPLRIGVSHGGASEKILSLPNAVEQIAQIKIYKNRLVVQAWLGPDEQGEIVIFDLRSSQLVDDFLEYRPVFSPDSRQIAFVKFYPAHFLQSYEDQEMLYDLDASPAQNRPAYGPIVPSSDKRSLFHHAGLPIYPLAAKELGRQNANLDDDKDVHRKISEFSWSADSKRVAFMDAQNSTAELVMVETSALLQSHAADFNAALVNASSAALPELRDVCSVQGDVRANTCIDFDYGATHLEVSNAAVTLSLSTDGDSPTTRSLRVESGRFRPVAR